MLINFPIYLSCSKLVLHRHGFEYSLLVGLPSWRCGQSAYNVKTCNCLTASLLQVSSTSVLVFLLSITLNLSQSWNCKRQQTPSHTFEEQWFSVPHPERLCLLLPPCWSCWLCLSWPRPWPRPRSLCWISPPALGASSPASAGRPTPAASSTGWCLTQGARGLASTFTPSFRKSQVSILMHTAQGFTTRYNRQQRICFLVVFRSCHQFYNDYQWVGVLCI